MKNVNCRMGVRLILRLKIGKMMTEEIPAEVFPSIAQCSIYGRLAMPTIRSATSSRTAETIADETPLFSICDKYIRFCHQSSIIKQQPIIFSCKLAGNMGRAPLFWKMYWHDIRGSEFKVLNHNTSPNYPRAPIRVTLRMNLSGQCGSGQKVVLMGK